MNVYLSLKETKLYSLNPNIWNVIILICISVAFIISDWTILYSSFGDFVLIFTMMLLLVLGKIEMTKKQVLIVGAVISLLAITIIVSYFFNEYWFNNRRAFLSTTKLIFYIMSTVILFNFIKMNVLLNTFLRISNMFAVAIIIIGLILTMLIYLEQDQIFRWVWTFTRIDNMSYYFIGNTDIVRTRSLFSEPAHLGFYLNTIFFSNLLSKTKNNLLVLFFITLGLFSTLSYSMIFIFITTLSSYIISRIIKGEFKWDKKYWLIGLPIIVLLVAAWDFINITIIQRTLSIFTGSDGSAYNRLIESWMYVEPERIFYGNGIGHTPPVTNLYAYLMSDFGLLGFLPYLGLTLFLLINNITTFVFFFTMNISKGGYLNPMYWMFLLYIFLYGISSKYNTQDKLKG